jgi:hypothetical protein
MCSNEKNNGRFTLMNGQMMNYSRYLKSLEETPYYDASEVLNIKLDMQGLLAYARKEGKKPIELTREERDKFIG